MYVPIENIVVDGIYAEGCHSTVRILSHGEPVNNVVIRNVFGSYYTYTIGLTKYHGPEDERGRIDNVVIENLFASSTQGTADVKGGRRPIVWVQKGLDVDGLSISNANRVEKTNPTPFLTVEEGASVKNLRLRDISQRSELGVEIPFIQFEGEVDVKVEENLSNR